MPHGVKSPGLQRADNSLDKLLNFLRSTGTGNYAEPGRNQAEEPPVTSPKFVVDPKEAGRAVPAASTKRKASAGKKSAVVSKMQRPKVSQRDLEVVEPPLPPLPGPAVAERLPADASAAGAGLAGSARLRDDFGLPSGELPDEPGAAQAALSVEEPVDTGDSQLFEYAMTQPDALAKMESGEIDILGLIKMLRARQGAPSQYPPGV